MNNDKNLLRQKSKDIRNRLNTEVISTAIANNIAQWDKYQSSHIIMLFYPIGSEINLLKLLDDRTKRFAFPVVEENNMRPVFYTKEKGFKTGAFNIQEPIGNAADINDIDLILMPALASDKKGYRLGYGKGYYDRFLNNITNATTAIPISEHLIFNSIPKEEHDKKADYIITENQIIKTELFQMIGSANVHNIT